jgi:HKD family nuclease
VLYSQPLATRFGTDLISYLGVTDWKSLDIAVAWVRASGMAHVGPALESFVKAGKRLRVIVGIDLDNTTKEGLEALTSLTSEGNVDLLVHHNEAGGVFHPKLYLLTAKSHARLIVGSNNLTQAGLYQNTEAGLSIDLPLSDATIQAAMSALDAWADTSSGLAKKLDANLLAELIGNGYVRDEATAGAESVSRRANAKKLASKKLFGSVPVSVPAPAKPIIPARKSSVWSKGAASKPGKTSTSAIVPSSSGPATGTVLLMRVRKASVSRRPTQTQLPKAVATQAFFAGISSVTSTHDGQNHGIHAAEARGIVNTLKLEIPEMRKFADPVIRFERTATDVVYEVYDSSSAKGKTIMNGLNFGLSTKPQSTFLTLPRNPSRATWWRFI